MAKKDEGYLLDSDGNPIRSESGEAVRTGSYDDEKVTQNRMKAAEDKLAEDVQEKLRADKAKDAEKSAKSPAAAPVKQPTRPGQGAAKSKAPIVTKEQLAKEGLSLRDYMNKQKNLTRRDGKAPEKAPSKAQSSGSSKSDFEAAQRKRSDMIVALTKAEREMPEGTSELAKKKIAEAKRKQIEDYGYAPKAEDMKAYKPRSTPGARKPKQTTGRAKPYMPEEPDMGFAKGGSVRGAGIARKGVRKCKIV